MDASTACCPSGVCYLAVLLKWGRWEYLISVPNNINKQVGSLIAWRTQGHSSQTLLWEFPWEPHNYWIKNQPPLHYEMRNKINSITWRENQCIQGVLYLCEGSRRASQQGCYCTHILQWSPDATQSTLYHSFTWSVCHICAQRSQLYLSQTMNVFTLGKTRHLA